MAIKVKLDDGAYMPTRAHNTDAGIDIYTPTRIVMRPRDSVFVDTGVHIEIPNGYFGDIRSKSGLMRYEKITTDGTVDCGYSGSVGVMLFNNSDSLVIFRAGEKIAQMVIQPCLIDGLELVDDIYSGERGANGFGSTGRK